MRLLRRRPEHAMLAYTTSKECVDRVTEFLLDGVRRGGCAIVIAQKDHAHALEGRLAGYAIHWRDAEETLQRILVDGRPDPAAFDTVVGRQVREAARRGPVYLFGEMVGILCSRGDYVAAIELEKMWNALLADVEAPLLCAYPASVFTSPEHAAHFQMLRRVHKSHLAGLPLAPRRQS